MNSEQREEVTRISDAFSNLADGSQIAKEDVAYLLELIDKLDSEISIRNTAIIEIDRKRQRYAEIVQEQDKTILGFQQKIIEIIENR